MVDVKVKAHRRKRPLKIVVKGRFVRERLASPREFAPASFRTEKRGKHRIIVACPKGHFHDEKCMVGTRAQAVLHPKSELGKNRKFRRVGGKIRRMK